MLGDKYGLPDALFFYQLLLLLHDTKQTIKDDPWMPFYQNVSIWSNFYAVQDLRIMVTGYGTVQHWVGATEFLQWDGSVLMDGVLGGSNGAFYRHFNSRENNTCYSPSITSAFTRERWHHLKRIYKLCGNKESPQRGQPNYNPAYKYDYIYKMICHNVNAKQMMISVLMRVPLHLMDGERMELHQLALSLTSLE